MTAAQILFFPVYCLQLCPPFARSPTQVLLSWQTSLNFILQSSNMVPKSLRYRSPGPHVRQRILPCGIQLESGNSEQLQVYRTCFFLQPHCRNHFPLNLRVLSCELSQLLRNNSSQSRTGSKVKVLHICMHFCRIQKQNSNKNRNSQRLLSLK